MNTNDVNQKTNKIKIKVKNRDHPNSTKIAFSSIFASKMKEDIELPPPHQGGATTAAV